MPPPSPVPAAPPFPPLPPLPSPPPPTTEALTLLPPWPPNPKPPKPPWPPVPPLATLDEKVVSDMERLVPTAVNTPPPNADPPEPPEPPAPPVPDCAVGACDVPRALAESASSALAAVTTDRLVRRNGAFRDDQRTGLVCNPSSKRRSAAAAISYQRLQLLLHLRQSRRWLRWYRRRRCLRRLRT